MRAAVYTRVSTDEQAQHGTSLEDQWRRGEAHARGLGAVEVERFEDAGESGSSLNRPALSALRAALALGAYNLVVVTDPDRLARRLVDQLLVTDEIARRATLAFVQFDWQDSADGRLFYALRGAVAEFEREKIRQRTHLGRQSAARAGRIAAVPHQAYGYAYDRAHRRLRTVPSEALVVREIYALCAEREWGSLRIARHLNTLGLGARHGGPWHPESVRRVLRNPLYAGRLRQLGGQVAVPAVVDEARWRDVQRVLDAHRGLRPGRARRAYLLRGLVICGLCGAPYVARAPGRDGRRRYVCAGRRRRRCRAPAVRAARLEGAVWRRVQRLLAGAAPPAPPPASATAPRALDLESERRRLVRLVRRGLLRPEEAERELAQVARASDLARRGAQAVRACAAPPPSRRARDEVRRALLRLLGAQVRIEADDRVRASLCLPPRPPRRVRVRRGRTGAS